MPPAPAGNMANFGGGRSGSSRTRKGIWAAVVLAGTLSVMLLFSAQRQSSIGVMLHSSVGSNVTAASVQAEMDALRTTQELQGVAMSQQSNENKAVRAELEKLQQAVDELQRGMAAAAHVAGPVKSRESSIMLLQDVPTCHIESHNKGTPADQPGAKQAAATQLDALNRHHQQEQERFCKEFAAGKASPGGTPNNDTYTRVPDVRVVGDPTLAYPMWVYRDSDIVSNEIMHKGVWENAETVNILARLEEWKQANQQDTSGVVLLDVGANVGWFTLQAAAMGYHVLAVEPMPRNQGALRRTLCENPKLAPKVTLIPKGLSDKPRNCQLYVLRLNKGNGTPVCEGAAFANLKNSPEYELAGDFPLTTLDELFNGTMDALAGRVQVVKIDVEGFEPQVYAGGRQFFGQVQPHFIMAELNQERNSATLPQTVLHLYNDLGYGVHLHGFEGPMLLPKDYDQLAQTQFAPPTINNIYMERLKPCEAALSSNN